MPPGQALVGSCFLLASSSTRNEFAITLLNTLGLFVFHGRRIDAYCLCASGGSEVS